MLLYTLTKKFIEVQKNMLNEFGIILFLQSGVVVRWPRHWCETNETNVLNPRY